MSLDRLLTEREIHRTLCRLARAMDERDWACLDTVFVEDATGDFGSGYQLCSRAEIAGMFRTFLGACGPTQHLLGNLVVESNGEFAESRCYIRDIHQGQGSRTELYFSTIGEYQDRWRHTSEGWRITHRKKVSYLTQGTLEVFHPSM